MRCALNLNFWYALHHHRESVSQGNKVHFCNSNSISLETTNFDFVYTRAYQEEGSLVMLGINSSTYCFLFRSVFLHTQSFHFPNFLHPYTSSEKNIKSYLSTYIIVAIYLQCLRDSIFSRASFQQKLFQLGFRKESFKIPP